MTHRRSEFFDGWGSQYFECPSSEGADFKIVGTHVKIVGTHLDFIIIDDPVKQERKMPWRERRRLRKWYRECIFQSKFESACNRAWFSWYRKKKKLERDRICRHYTWNQYRHWIRKDDGTDTPLIQGRFDWENPT